MRKRGQSPGVLSFTGGVGLWYTGYMVKSENGGSGMVWAFKGSTLVEKEWEQVAPGELWAAVIGPEELDKALGCFSLDGAVGERFYRSLPAYFEACEGYDYMIITLPDEHNFLRGQKRVDILLREGLLLLLCRDEDAKRWVESLFLEAPIHGTSLPRLLCILFERLIYDDMEVLDELEGKINDLEEMLITSKNTDCTQEIFRLRGQLRALKRYYEQLVTIADSLLENENGLVEGKTLRYIKALRSRVERLYGYTLGLREGVTQVREAYQAQVDIDLNRIMKLFTVVTTILLPLTLIAGWYGMNLQMPEFGWVYGYPFVIGLSLLVVVGCVVYFRRNRWF